MTYQANNSGINSLGGFAYQIKVFAYYMTIIHEGEQVEFETLDDVNINTVQRGQINETSGMKCNINAESNIAIQVKRTSIDSSTADKVIYNWLLLEMSDNSISQYTLVTDKEYHNNENIFHMDENELFNTINTSDRSASALISKVKQEIDGNYEKLVEAYNNIKHKFIFTEIEDIDSCIWRRFEVLFRRAAISERIYQLRLEELLKYINMQIINAVCKKKSFKFSYQQLISQVEEICSRIGNERVALCYSTFISAKSINFEDLEITKSREYIQLKYCQLDRLELEEHFQYKLYYEEIRDLYMENTKVQLVEDIERTTYQNYRRVKGLLTAKGEDMPMCRLYQTEQQSNSYAGNEQIRFGSAIYLTKDDIDDERQISWKEQE